jgi:hypothetical protein
MVDAELSAKLRDLIGGYRLTPYDPSFEKKSRRQATSSAATALALHDRLLALHGGAAGLRDRNLHQSALARPQQYFAYSESPDMIGMAAAYSAGFQVQDESPNPSYLCP